MPEPDNDFIWNTTSGDWNEPAHWNPLGPPGTSSHTATFGNSIGSGAETVFTNTAVTVNSIAFANTMNGTYAIGGVGSVNLERGTSVNLPVTGVSISAGNHQFQINVALQDNATASMASVSTLKFNNRLFLNGHTLSKAGPGTIAINNDIVSGGGTVDILQGTVTGVGTIGGDLNNNGGTISPGSSSGQATSLVPEPASWVMLGLGLFGWLAMSKRRVQ